MRGDEEPVGAVADGSQHHDAGEGQQQVSPAVHRRQARPGGRAARSFEIVSPVSGISEVSFGMMRDPGSGLTEAAAQGAHEFNVKFVGAALEVGDDAPLVQHCVLGQQDGLEGREAAFVAKTGDPPRVL